VSRQRNKPASAQCGVRANLKAVKTSPISRTKPQKPKEDPYYPAAVERATEAARRLQRAGITDAQGRRIRKDLPTDMREGQDRDFGG